MVPNDHPQLPVDPAAETRDRGYRCPACDYNLTGLSTARCPECGEPFDWNEVRKAAERSPAIAFETSTGWRKIGGFMITWATVLFVPWVFARQIVSRVGTRDALAFVGVCYGLTFVFCVLHDDWEFGPTWVITASAYIVMQAIWLTALDTSGWRELRSSFRFWLLAGCYTSAVMVTECFLGPPILMLDDLLSFVTTGQVDSWFDDLFELTPLALVWWTQLLVWLAGLSFILARRVARRRVSGPTYVFTAFVAISLLFLYATAVRCVGPFAAELMDVIASAIFG